MDFQELCSGLKTSPCMSAFIQLEQDLYCIKTCDIKQIITTIGRAGIIGDTAKTKGLLMHILEISLKRPLAVQFYAKLCVQLFIHTKFYNKDFDFKSYAAEYLFSEISKERDLYRLSFMVQFLYWIKVFGGFTPYYISTLIQKHTSAPPFNFIASMFLFTTFALDLNKYQPLLFISLKNSFLTASKNRILPPVLLQFESYFDDFRTIAQIYSDSFIQALVEDDVDKFIVLCSSPFFDPNMKAPYSILFTPKYPIDSPHLIDCAALCGSEKIFRYLFLTAKLQTQKDIDQLGRCAIAGGSIPIIRLCIQQGANVYHLVEVATEYHRFELLNWMLSFDQSEHVISASFDMASKTNDILSFFILYSNTGMLYGKPIHFAARHASIDILQFLKYAKLPINFKDFDSTGMTPLHHAVLSGSLTCVKLVLSMGYDINEKDYTGYSALDLANINNLEEISKYLQKVLESDDEEKESEEVGNEKRSKILQPLAVWHLLIMVSSIFLGENIFAENSTTFDYIQQIFFEKIFIPPMFDTRIYHSPNNNNNRNN